jgi:hypothetical protein
MKSIAFQYPFMIFDKCRCTQQVPLKKINIASAAEATTLTWKAVCTCCGEKIHRSFKLKEGDIIDMSHVLNAYKVIPSIKNDLVIIRLDSFKVKLKNNNTYFYGDYSQLRLFDNVIEHGVMPVDFIDLTRPYALLLEQ